MTARILIVDDNPSDVSIMEIVLRDAGLVFDLEVCRDGDEASRRFSSLAPGDPWPDLVILDLALPKKNGREVLHEIKRNPALADLPVLILTSDAAPDEVSGFRAYRNTTCLMKPFLLRDYTPIVALIRGVLSHLNDRQPASG